MGLNIHLGGVAADMGAALGAGISKGVDEGLKQRREDQLLAQKEAKESAAAQEMIGAIKANYATELERQSELMPDVNPGQATMVQTGIPAAFGGVVPMYLNPTPSKGQEQIDGLGEAYAKGIQSFSNPQAAAMYTEAAVASLDEAHSGFIKESLQSSISHAVRNKAVDESEAAPFIEGIALGEDPREVYKQWQEFANEQVQSRRDSARVERMAVGMDEATLSFRNQAAGDPESSPWLNAQAKEMEDLAVWVRETARYGHSDLDAQKVWGAYQEIKHRLNPEQKHRQDKEMEAFRQEGRRDLAAQTDKARARREQRTALQKSLEAALEARDSNLALELTKELISLDEDPGQDQEDPLAVTMWKDVQGQSEDEESNGTDDGSAANVPERITQATVRDGVSRMVQKISAESYPTPTDAMADAQALLQLAYQQWGVTETKELPAKVQSHFKALEQAALEKWPDLANAPTPATQKPNAALPVID